MVEVELMLIEVHVVDRGAAAMVDVLIEVDRDPLGRIETVSEVYSVSTK